eukprot:5758195-Amphidinium_carterae.3
MTEAILSTSGVQKLHNCKTLADKSKPDNFDDGLFWSVTLLELRLYKTLDLGGFPPSRERPSQTELEGQLAGMNTISMHQPMSLDLLRKEPGYLMAAAPPTPSLFFGLQTRSSWIPTMNSNSSLNTVNVWRTSSWRMSRMRTMWC